MKLKIISAEKQVLEESEVNSISIPATEGQMQILPGHANIVAELGIGDVRVKDVKGEKEYFINGGYMIVREDYVVILVDNAESPDELVLSHIEESIARAKEQIEKTTNPAELIQLEKQLRYEKFKRDSVVR